MPFKEINADQLLEEQLKDPIFARHYNEIEKEYKLIAQVVKARKDHNMTQKDLANLIGVSQQTISRFEKERHMPTLDNFIKIIDALDLDLQLVRKSG